MKLSENVAEVYPQLTPPLRGDRDTILVGMMKQRGPQQVVMTGESNGKAVQMQWQVGAEESHDDFRFLPELVNDARKDQGATLATVGSVGHRETGRLIQVAADRLSQLGATALGANDPETARVATAAALQRDPTNPNALVMTQALEKRVKTDDDDLRIVRFQPPPVDQVDPLSQIRGSTSRR